jgi:hypothetical protein
MGWNRMLEGWVSKHWAIVQQRYYNIIRSKHTGCRWVISFIKKLWDTAWELWGHHNKVVYAKENPLWAEQRHQSACEMVRLFHGLSAHNLLPRDHYLLHLQLGHSRTKMTNSKLPRSNKQLA